MDIYDIDVKGIDGKKVNLGRYKGKVLLIVNTATECGLTPQYEGLEKLYQEYKGKDFEILDFPCNQFGNQAPGTNEEIKNFCELKYHTTFPSFAKIDVNGKEADPLYVYLKEHANSMLGKDIKWNFTKFLVDKTGNVIKRYSPTTEPNKLEGKISDLLAA